MTCVLLGLVLNCLASPAPPPAARRALLAPYQSYIATERPEGLRVIIFLLPTVVEIPAPPPITASYYSAYPYSAAWLRPSRGRRR
ncbi:MAG: hypothetical protein V4597_08435 [Pseudomonadota bacterium]